MRSLFIKNNNLKSAIALFILFGLYMSLIAFNSQKDRLGRIGMALAQSTDDFLINIGSKQTITVLNDNTSQPSATPTPAGPLPISDTPTPSSTGIPSNTPIPTGPSPTGLSDDFIIGLGYKQSLTITILAEGTTPTRSPTPTQTLPTNTLTPNPTPLVTPSACVFFFNGECRSGCYDDEFRLDNLSAICEQSDNVCCICPIVTPPLCNNGTIVAVTAAPGRGCPYYTCVPLSPTATSGPSPTGPTPTGTSEEFVINPGNKGSLTINISDSTISTTPTDISSTPVVSTSPTSVAPTATTFPVISPTLTVSPTPDYSNEYVVDVGNKRSITINIGGPILTPTPSGPPVACTSDNQCLDSQRCDLVNNICKDFACPVPPSCNTYAKINHQCILVNLPDGTSCVDVNNNSAYCYSGVCSLTTPTPTVTPTFTPTITPTSVITPTEIPVDPSTPRIRFNVKLFGVSSTPDIKVRLKVADLVARLTPAPSAVGDSCKTPGEAEYFYSNIIMAADVNGVYRPKSGTTFDTAGGLASVGADGWIPLVGLTPTKIYSLTVKGPLHRNRLMEANTTLVSGQSAGQDFDWTLKLLEPGDLPNPNINMTQDCTVNSIDLSLIESRIGNTDPGSNAIADVNYDSIVNGNDIAKVVYTISFKPDDD